MIDTAHSSPQGLTTNQVVESRKKYGKNVNKGHDYTTLKIILKTLFSIFNIIMGVLIIILIAVGQGSIGQFIGIVAGINTAIELIQEIRARLIVRRLSKLSEKTTKVVRDEKTQEIPLDELVLGDTIYLSSGDRVPVDGELTSSQYAEFDESILTGESKYIQKKEGEEIRAGSFLSAGNCYYKATKFTRDSYIQTLTKEIAKQNITESPLQSQINQIIKALTYMTIFFIALITVEGLAQESQKEEIILNAAVLISTLVPQGLVLITTISFAYGAMKIAKNQAIVQRLSAIESMANAKVVCVDKTGTLTKNVLEVKEIKLV
jgi:cation-transporting ATPase E